MFTSREATIDYTALKTYSLPFPGYEVSLGTSFAKVDRLGAGNNCN